MTRIFARVLGLLAVAGIVFILLVAFASCARAPRYRSFGTPEDAVRGLTGAVIAGNVDEVAALFGPEGRDLIDSSDPAMARRNQQIFAAAVAERWRLEERGPSFRVLIVGNEDWPFPVPIVKDAAGWRFDTALGKEEVLARRIGRNELAAIQICRTYVTAQDVYAQYGHDGRPAGLYAESFRSDPGMQNGLYWVAARGQKRSPLGELVAEAAAEGHRLGPDAGQPSPFHGYYFRILPTQRAESHALVAWPAQYDVTGIMTFTVTQDGIVYEKDLGAGTDAAARTMTAFVADGSWAAVQ